MLDYYVYIYFRPNGIPCYVGKGRGRRWLRHEAAETNQRLARIIALAGGSLPKVKIRENLAEAEAFETEASLIAAIGRVDLGKGPLVNLTNGWEGFSGGRHDAISRAKIGAASANTPRTQQWRKRISVANSGRVCGPLSEEHRAKVSYSLKTSVKAAAHIKALADNSRGKPLSKEHSEKIALANLGAKRSEEARRNMSAAQKRREHVRWITIPQAVIDAALAKAAPITKLAEIHGVPRRTFNERVLEARAKIRGMA